MMEIIFNFFMYIVKTINNRRFFFFEKNAIDFTHKHIDYTKTEVGLLKGLWEMWKDTMSNFNLRLF